MSAVEDLATDPASRRRFLTMMGGGTAAAGVFGVLLTACGGGDDDEADSRGGGGSGGRSESEISPGPTPPPPAAPPAKAAPDVEIVNYALTLEQVEADFYRDVVDSGLFGGRRLDLLKVIGDHELQHVEALTATVNALGGTPVAKPETRFELESPRSVLRLAATIENLGAAAYLGQAGRIRSKEVLAAALAIHTVEARHASALNRLAGRSATPDGAFAKPASMDEVLPMVRRFIV